MKLTKFKGITLSSYLLVYMALTGCGKSVDEQLKEQQLQLNQQTLSQSIQQPAYQAQQAPISPQPQYLPAPQVIVAPAASNSNGMLEGMMLGGIMGHAIGSNNNSNGNNLGTNRVINRTVINRTVINQPNRPTTIRPSQAGSFKRR